MESIPAEHNRALAQLKELESKHLQEATDLKEKAKVAARKLRNVRKGIAALSETEDPFLSSADIEGFVLQKLNGGKSYQRAELILELTVQAKKSGHKATGLGLALDRALKSKGIENTNGLLRLPPSKA